MQRNAYTKALSNTLLELGNGIYVYMVMGVQTLVSAISMHVIHQELKEYGGLKNVVYQAANKVFSFLGKANPLIEIEEFANEVKRNGGTKEFFGKKTQQEKEYCASKANMTVKEVDTLAKCMIRYKEFEGDFIEQGKDFAECAGISPLNIMTEFREFSTLTQCLIRDMKATTKQAKVIVSQLTKEIDMRQFSEDVAKVKKDGFLELFIQKEMKIPIDSCVYTIGDDLEEAHNKLICFEQMLDVRAGIAQKLQSFVKCSNITIDNAADEVQNTVALVQCVGQEVEKGFISMSVNAQGDMP